MRVSTVAPNISEAAWPADLDTFEVTPEATHEAPLGPGIHTLFDSFTAHVATPEPGWPFRLDHLGMEGRVFVNEDHDTGNAHVRAVIDGKGGATSLQLEAEVRESWLCAACGDASSDSERATAIVQALTRIAELPNQHTVRVQATVV